MAIYKHDRDDLYCPECGSNVDEEGYTELEGHFRTGTVVFRCDTCLAYVQDGEWLNYTGYRENFA